MISGENDQNWSIFGFSMTPLRLGVELRLGEPKTLPENFLLRLGIAPLHLGVAPLRLGVAPLRLGEPLRLGIALLHLGQATVSILFFLRLILEYVTLLFGLSMEYN